MLTDEQRQAFQVLRGHYGPRYNDGHAGPFGGYSGRGHWENRGRWISSAWGILQASLTRGLAREGLHVLDVGCGRGALVHELRNLGARAVGVDLAFDFVDRGPMVQGNAMELPFVAQAFDLVVALDVVEHVPGPWRPLLLAELRRVARSLVVATVPTGYPRYDLAWTGVPRNHYASLAPATWSQAFLAAGFNVEAFGPILGRVYGAPFNHGPENYPFLLVP